MVDKGLIQKLDSEGTIDKRYVLWWQLGYEGRRVFTEEEFAAGLETVRLNVFVGEEETAEKEFRIWKRDDVPILIKNINIDGIDVSCFISVKPASHWPGPYMETERPQIGPFVYDEPHIRGAVIELTERFLFWYPFSFGYKPTHYDTRGRFVEDENMWCLIHPIHPTKFYRNIAEKWRRKGKRAQKRAEEFKYGDAGFELVPYFEFDKTKSHVMVYPVRLCDRTLDLPVIVAAKHGTPEIVGVGYPVFGYHDYNMVNYWKLNEREQRFAEDFIRAKFS